MTVEGEKFQNTQRLEKPVAVTLHIGFGEKDKIIEVEGMKRLKFKKE